MASDVKYAWFVANRLENAELPLWLFKEVFDNLVWAEEND